MSFTLVRPLRKLQSRYGSSLQLILHQIDKEVSYLSHLIQGGIADAPHSLTVWAVMPTLPLDTQTMWQAESSANCRDCRSVTVAWPYADSWLG